MQSLNEVAYQTILSDILKLKFRPGERIQDKDLVDRLKISRTPVREAILRLKNDGLMTTVPQSGTYVTRISLKSALNARFVRQSVERDVAKKAATDMNESDILDTKTLISKQELATKQNNSEDFFYLDNDFHKKFYSATDKDEVWTWLQALTLQLDRYRFLRIQQSEMPVDKILQQHRGIVEAIENHDKALAGRRAFNHLNLMLAEKDNLLKKFPDYFEENH